MKATTSHAPLNDASVDRQTRISSSSFPPRSPVSRSSRSPRRPSSRTVSTKSRSRSITRSRSPYRRDHYYDYGNSTSDRRHKRRRDHDYDYDESFYDDRHSRRGSSHLPSSGRFSHRYDDDSRYYERSGPPRRHHRTYYDYDREEDYGYGSGSGAIRYSDDYDYRRRDKRRRTQSRSPYQEVRKPKQYSSDELDTRRHEGPTGSRLSSTRNSDTRQGLPTTAEQDSVRDAETRKNNQVSQEVSTATSASVVDEYVLPIVVRSFRRAKQSFSSSSVNSPAPPSEGQGQEQAEPLDESARLEARRKRREAIKAKYRGQATPLRIQALHTSAEADSGVPNADTNKPNQSPSSGKLNFL